MLRRRGFSLIELLVAVVVVTALATLAYPGFAHALHKTRRGDAVVRLLQVQQAQERWRSNRPAYASLHELALPAQAPDGWYRLSVTQHDSDSFVAMAQATGSQAGDAPCRFMRLAMSAGQTTLASGPDAAAGNDEAANRRCWNR